MNKFNHLRKWLHLENDHIRMFTKESRGLYSINDIKKGERIMEIPEKYILELSTINNPKVTDKLMNTNSYFAMYLLLESLNKKSYWKVYLDSLPEDLNEYIYYYDEDKLSQLKNTTIMCSKTYNFLIHMKNIKKDSMILYKTLKNHKMEYDDFFKLFLKFRIYICSRIFGYDKNNSHENGIVPYADLLNHSQNANTKWYYDSIKNVFVVEATKNIKKNTEIYDSYGHKTNMQLLLYYGFTIKSNKHSELNFVYKNELFTIDYNTNIKELIADKNVINKLKKILEHHTTKLKNNEIKDNNILNIYNDEINLIKKILQMDDIKI